MPDDAFDTASLRGGSWMPGPRRPRRFREDANAEEDYALGGYRDRVVVELAQNAADAAARAGVPGRLRLTLRADGTLTADNTGAPLDVAGVEGLLDAAGLRASGRRPWSPRSAGSASGSRPWSRSAMSRGWSHVPERSSGRGRGLATWSRASPPWRRAGRAGRRRPRCAAAVPGTISRSPGRHGPGWRRPRLGPAPAFDTTVVLPLRDADAVALARTAARADRRRAAAGPPGAGRG